MNYLIVIQLKLQIWTELKTAKISEFKGKLILGNKYKINNTTELSLMQCNLACTNLLSECI